MADNTTNANETTPQQPQQPPELFNPTNAENPTGNTTNPAIVYSDDNAQQQPGDFNPRELERELRTEAGALATELAQGNFQNETRYEQIKRRLQYLQEADGHRALIAGTRSQPQPQQPHGGKSNHPPKGSAAADKDKP
jgi:hypothetical protein